MGAEIFEPLRSLRERKKALTHDTVESTALRLFLDRGYDRVRLEDICSDSLISLRTFFRYFNSKEDLVLGRLRAHLGIGAQLLADRPPKEPVIDSLHIVITQIAYDYVVHPERECTRLRLVTTTPALQTGLLDVFAGFESIVREFAVTRISHRDRVLHARLVAAAAVSAFRLGLETWLEEDAAPDLAVVVSRNLELLTPNFQGAQRKRPG